MAPASESAVIRDPFDRGGRYMVRENRPLLGWLLSLQPEDYDFVTWLDTRGIAWPGAPEQTRDTLAHLLDRQEHGVPWAVLAEFQFKPDPDMLSRVLIYLGEARLRLKPSKLPGDRFHIGAVIVNLTGRGKTSHEMNWPGAGLRTLMQVREVNLEAYPASFVLEAVDLEVAPLAALAFISLMQGGAENGIIQRWKGLAQREPDRHKRADLAYVVQTMAELTGCKQAWIDGLEGFNVQESQLLNDWTKQLVQRGEQRGALENAVEFILDQLANRPGTVTPDLAGAIRAIKDQARLKELNRLAGQTTSVEQFRIEANL